jgi:hypothetical protein
MILDRGTCTLGLWPFRSHWILWVAIMQLFEVQESNLLELSHDTDIGCAQYTLIWIEPFSVFGMWTWNQANHMNYIGLTGAILNVEPWWKLIVASTGTSWFLFLSSYEYWLRHTNQCYDWSHLDIGCYDFIWSRPRWYRQEPFLILGHAGINYKAHMLHWVGYIIIVFLAAHDAQWVGPRRWDFGCEYQFIDTAVIVRLAEVQEHALYRLFN